MIYIGVDPGLTGAICAIDDDDNVLLKMQTPLNGKKEIDCRIIAIQIQKLKRNSSGKVFGVLEKVGAMPGQGVVAMFTFGHAVGEVKATLKIMTVPFQEVTPQTWKAEILKGLPWKAQTTRYKADKHFTDEANLAVKKALASKNRQAKKKAKLVSCEFISKRFPSLDIHMGSKNPNDGIADALCMALYARFLQRG